MQILSLFTECFDHDCLQVHICICFKDALLMASKVDVDDMRRFTNLDKLNHAKLVCKSRGH